MKSSSIDEPLYAHVSDPPEVLHDGVKYVANDSLMNGNFSLHLFKHVSDPPEGSNGGVKCAKENALIDRNFDEHLFKHVSDPPEARMMMDVKSTKIAYPHKSDPPMDDARKVALKATSNLDMNYDEHHSDPPEKALNEVKLCSNLTNPCFALALDHRCYPYLVPWTEMIWLFKFLMCMNCYCTTRILFHR